MVKISLRRSDADLRGTATLPGGVEPLWGESGRALPYAIWALRLQLAVGGGFRNVAGGVGGNFGDNTRRVRQNHYDTLSSKGKKL